MTLQIGDFECPILNFNLGFSQQDFTQPDNQVPRERLMFISKEIDPTQLTDFVSDIIQNHGLPLVITSPTKTYTFYDYIFEGVNIIGDDNDLSININFTKQIDLINNNA